VLKELLIGGVLIGVGIAFFAGTYLRATGSPPKRIYLEALVGGALFVFGGIRLCVLALRGEERKG
jgi:uncharacterized membrane protein YgdD (TMEM256/DUF423 family)